MPLILLYRIRANSKCCEKDTSGFFGKTRRIGFRHIEAALCAKQHRRGWWDQDLTLLDGVGMEPNISLSAIGHQDNQGAYLRLLTTILPL